MNSNNSTLKQILASDLPPGFVRELIIRFHSLYPDAYEAVYQNPEFGEAEAEYLLGHHRRALAEVGLREIATKHSLTVRMEKPEKGGCKHVLISTGILAFTTCHVPSYSGFPKYSNSREQYALINEHASQGQLFAIESNPDKEELYGILIHTEDNSKKNGLGSLRIGFPNPEFNNWIEAPIDLQEISDIQQRIYQKKQDLQQQIQNPTPKWKSDNKQESQEGDS